MYTWEFFNDSIVVFAILMFLSHLLYKLFTFRVKGEFHEKFGKYSLFQKTLVYLNATLIFFFAISLILAILLHPGRQ